MEIGERIDQLIAEEPDGPAVQYENEWWTWADLGRIRDGLGAIFDANGIRAGEGIGLVLRQRPHALGAYVGVLSGARSAVLVTPIQPDLAMRGELLSLRLRVVVADAQDWAREGMVAAAREAGSIGVELTADRASPVRLVEGLETAGPDPHYPPAPGVAVTVLTSGTTGPPKRIPVAYSQFRGEPPTNEREPWKRGVNIGAVPLVSIGGVLGMAQSLWRGRPTSLMERFDVVKWAELVKEHKPRQLGAPPAALRMLLDAKVPKEYLASGTMFVAGSAPVDLATSDEFEAVYGIPVVRSYGATEFLGNAMGFNPDELHLVQEKRGSVGRTRPGIKMRILDIESGEEVGPGVTGILQLDTPKRAAGAEPGWIATNDLARVDEDGFVWIMGRADGVLIRGGFKVSTDEVTAVLKEHPSVADAAVVGRPDPRLNQVPVALVVLKAGAPAVSREELMAWVKERKPPYCVPAEIAFGDAIPRNAMFKMVPGQVREMIEKASA